MSTDQLLLTVAVVRRQKPLYGGFCFFVENLIRYNWIGRPYSLSLTLGVSALGPSGWNLDCNQNSTPMLQQYLPGVQEDVPLKNYTTFRIGGSARYFFVAHTKEDIQKAVQAATKEKIPFFLLAGGSNVLVLDQGFSGLVVKIENTRYKIRDTSLDAEAGVEVPTLVQETTERGLAGLEWAGGLPGSIGGAVRGNAGAFGGEIKDSVLEVEALNESGDIQVFTRKQCDFSYRSSIFKQKDLAVLSVTLQLRKGDKEELESIAQDHIKYREERHPLEYPNAGSIFKNCDLNLFSKQQQKDMKDVIKEDPFPVIPTAYLIAQAMLQGMRLGGAAVSEKHPNYMINVGEASAKDVVSLIKKVKQEIKNKFGIELQEEIQFVGGK